YINIDMWVLLESREVVRAIARHAIPKHILKEYEAWKNIVVTSSPSALRGFSGLRDHALQGEWAGHRASYLSAQWRVIYRVDANAVEVAVVRVSAHDY